MTPPSTGTASPDRLLAHVEWVRRLARVLVADGNDAADVEQETWRLALERPPRDEGDLRGWLATVARNVARKFGRTSDVRARHEREAAPHPSTRVADAAADVTARAELHRRVVEAVLALDELYRAPLLLRFFDDLSAVDVAKRLGVPVETARTRIKRGLALVRERLGGGFLALAPMLFTPRSPAPSDAAVATSGSAVAGIVLGGALMSKFAKVATAVVVAGAAAIGSYQVWIAPSTDVPRIESVARPESEVPSPAPTTVPAAADAPVPVDRELVEHDVAETPAPAASLATIEGVVLDAGARPIANAAVLVGRRSHDWFKSATAFGWSGRSMLDSDQPEPSWQRTHSESDGTFRLENVDPLHQWAVGAIHESIGMGWTDAVNFDPETATARVTVMLERGTVVFGTVRDSKGEPLAAMRVTIMGSRKPPSNPEPGFSFEELIDYAISGEDGSYRSMPRPWRHVKLHVLAYGRPELAQLATPWEEVPAGITEIERDLTVSTLHTLRGRILGPDGKPARLVQTVLPRLGDDGARTQSATTLAVVAFADDPRARPELLEQLYAYEPGTVYLDGDRSYGTLSIAEDRYEMPLRSDLLQYVAVVARRKLLGVAKIPDPPVEIDVVIDPELVPERTLVHPLRLKLRDARDGSPLEGVNVNGLVVRRDGQGRLSVSILHLGSEQDSAADRDLELPIDRCTLFMTHERFAGRSIVIEPRRPGAPRELTVSFVPAAGSADVRATDESGAPVSGASCRVYRMAENDAVVLDQLSTDEHGHCKLPGLPAGDFVVVVERSGLVPGVATATLIEGSTPVEVTLQRGYEVTLKARLPDGSPAPIGQFSITDESGTAIYDQFLSFGHTARLSSHRVRLVDGNYTVRCLVTDEYEGQADFVAAPGAEIDVMLQPIR